MTKKSRKRSPYQKPYVLKLSDAQWSELISLKDRLRQDQSHDKVTVARLLRSAIDEMLDRHGRMSEGWGFIEIPPVPHQKLLAVVRQGVWTDVDAAVQHATAVYLDRLATSPSPGEFEQRLLRDRVYLGSTKPAKRGRKDNQGG